MTQNPRDLQTILHQAAAATGGVLPFVRFMELCLYHPEQGYYMRKRCRIGRGGDFVTAPTITSLFGELITLQWIEVWEQLSRPRHFDLIELGAGGGELAADILRTAGRFPEFARALRYSIIETSPDFCRQQQQTLAPLRAAGTVVRWHANLDTLTAALPEGIVGGILSNEFFDALPVHWLTMTTEGLRALGATWRDDRWQMVTMALPEEIPADYFTRRGLALAIGQQTEIGLHGVAWMRRLGTLMRRGVILTIDYGHPGREYHHAAYHAGHLVGHHRHARVDDPLAFPGEMDLTSHVDFSALASGGAAAGLATLGFTTQGWFLLGLGILTRLERLLARENLTREQREQLQGAVHRLIMPEAMGERFKVLAQGIDLPPGLLLAGFGLNDQQHRL
ncbi:MAG: SAM-dependent methyltransferase [Magnetococcales bacterium]|nr:SAM-dependent methyltransferase [Magnetococcales bacterium]